MFAYTFVFNAHHYLEIFFVKLIHLCYVMIKDLKHDGQLCDFFYLNNYRISLNHVYNYFYGSNIVYTGIPASGWSIFHCIQKRTAHSGKNRILARQFQNQCTVQK